MNPKIFKNPKGFFRRFLSLVCFLLLVSALIVNAQDKTLSGKIIDETGGPIPGAIVQNKTTKKGTISDMNGRYSLIAKAGDEIVFSFLGYITQTLKVGILNTLDIALVSDTRSLNEVVVIGYGTQKKANVSGAVSNFKADNLEERPVGRVDQAMVGQMAGLLLNKLQVYQVKD